MRKELLSLLLIAAVLITVPPAADALQAGSLPEILERSAPAPLSAAETEGVLLMREEEKLARDLYSALYDIWGVPIFANIARSEQTHMDWMGLILERYSLADPLPAGDGTYRNPDLQNIYDELLEKGSRSLADAFLVGAAVEELDIADLERLTRESDNDDLRIVYQNLNKGSRNHLRSFNAQLSRESEVYTPVHIDEALYRAIVRSGNERGTITDPLFTFPERR